jgi:hypothetical protein
MQIGKSGATYRSGFFAIKRKVELFCLICELREDPMRFDGIFLAAPPGFR